MLDIGAQRCCATDLVVWRLARWILNPTIAVHFRAGSRAGLGIHGALCGWSPAGFLHAFCGSCAGLRLQAVSAKPGPRGVTVSTLDSESSDRGSNPREVFRCIEVSIMRRGGLVPARFLHAFYGSCAGLR